jgi:hypothetical protein
LTRASAGRCVAALVALIVAWVALPGGVPLYDGLNFPDEPYRYVAPPSGYQKTPAPDHASGTAAAAGGVSAATVYVNTDEQAPQVNVVIFKGQLAVSAGVRSLAVSAVPEAADRQPSKGRIDGNVYRISAAATPAGTVTWAPPPGDAAGLSQVVLRATSAAKPAPVFLHRSGPTLAWTTLPTAPIGNDIYRTQFAGFGDYALAFGVVATAPASHLGTYLLIAVPVLVLLLAAGAVLLVRTRRRSS